MAHASSPAGLSSGTGPGTPFRPRRSRLRHLPADSLRGGQAARDRACRAIVQRGRRFEGFTPEGFRVVEWAPAHPRRLRRAAAGGRRDAPGAERASRGSVPSPPRSPWSRASPPPFHAQHPNVRLTVLSQTSQQTPAGDSIISISISALPISTMSRSPMSAHFPSIGSAMCW